MSCSETVHRRRASSGSLIATLQGIAALVTSGRAQAGQIDALVTDAVALFIRGQRT